MAKSIFEGYKSGAELYDAREAKRIEAERRNEELLRQGYSFENGEMKVRPNSMADAEQQQAKETALRTKALLGRVFKQDTAQALEDFSLTGDASYLNNDLNSSPEKKAAWMQRGVHLVENINFEQDTSLLRTAGFNPHAYDTEEKRNTIRHSAYKFYDGKEWRIGLANNVIAETGAGKVLGKRRLQPAIDNHKQFAELLRGPKSSPYTAEGHKYEREIRLASEDTGLPPNLISAMMATESSNNPDAVSTVRGKSYTGLMQVGEAAAKDVGIEDRNASPEANVLAGARYMKKMLDKYNGDVKLALAAYNAGPAKVDEFGGIPPYSETQNYVKKITANLDSAESYYGNTAQDIYDAFLQADREKFAASQGKTVDQLNRETEAGIDNTVSSTAVNEKNVATADRKLDQEDRSLDIQEGNLVLKAKELTQTKDTTKRKELNEAEQAEVGLYEEFGGFEQFMNKDFEIGTKDYTKAYGEMIAIEQLTGMEPSDAQLKEMGELRTMASLFGKASELTPEQTGLVDTTLKGIEKYLNENMVEGEASAAYNSIKNLYIHSLAGTAQSEAEAKRIVKAFGTDSQKLGPVLVQLNGILQQKISELDSVMRDMHPVSAKMRLGVDMEKMLRTRRSLDKTVGYMDAKAKFLAGKGPDPDKRPPLDSFITEE